MLLVWKSFIKNLLTVKSSDCQSLLAKLHTSNPYNNTGIRFNLMSWRTTSSDAIRPTLPKIPFTVYIYKTPFNRAFNFIFGKVGRVASFKVIVELMKKK